MGVNSPCESQGLQASHGVGMRCRTSSDALSPRAFKTAGQTVITHVGSSGFVRATSPRENQGLRCRAVSDASNGIGMGRRTSSEISSPKAFNTYTQRTSESQVLTRTGAINRVVATSPRYGGSPRCRTTSDASCVIGVRLRTASDVTDVSAARTSPRLLGPKVVPVEKRNRATTKTSLTSVQSLPKSEVDWLMGTLQPEDLSTFDSRFFKNDCRRRFQELDKDRTGLLSFDNLKDALVEMYPTLQVDLAIEGHRIPAMHKSIPNLIATFDSDCDGKLSFDDFVAFVKFQRAWRDQFFFKQGSSTKSDTHKAMSRSSVSYPENSGITERRTSTSYLDNVSMQPITRKSCVVKGPIVLKRHSVLDKSRGGFYSSFNSSLDKWMGLQS